jgi:hypothetical protein
MQNMYYIGLDVSHQLLRVVRSREEFRQYGATHAAVEANIYRPH